MLYSKLLESTNSASTVFVTPTANTRSHSTDSGWKAISVEPTCTVHQRAKE